jgi:beta-ribofuranosylaminobenzene 5'-phosphate synthase
MTSRATVFVETAARLHFGILDLGGALGRWFGGVGAAAPGPTLLLSVSPADTLEVAGEDAVRAAEFARRFLAHYQIRGGARIDVLRALPAHAGLGSGTQLSLAIGRALATLHGIDADAPALARAAGRTRRSAIGTWTFESGGLVVDGGHRVDSRDPDVAPLLVRLPLSPHWRCVVAIPQDKGGIHGSAEEAAFAALPRPSDSDAQRVAHLVLMALLPAAAEADLKTFGCALTAIQSIVGKWFECAQGGVFAPGRSEELVRHMSEWGAAGVGQSSWGPAVYGIVTGEDAAAWLADRVRAFLGTAGSVYEGPFRNEGARCWHA